MGRLKLHIRRLETATARQITYSKRKAGLAKKAMELSVLCDVDVALIMFSPAGKPTTYIGGDNDLSGIIERFTVLPFEERSRRKVEILEIMRKAFRKVGHELDMERLLGDGVIQKVEDLQSQMRYKQALIQEKNRKISYWSDPSEVTSFPEVVVMEECLVESLARLRKRKVLLEEQLLHHALTQAQTCAWPPGQYFSRSKSNGLPNVALPPLRDFGYYGNTNEAMQNARMAGGFDQAQQA